MNTQQEKSFDFKASITGAFLAVLVMMPVTYKYVQYKLSSVDTGSQIVVVDFAKTIADLSIDGPQGMDMSIAVSAMDDLIERLSGAGVYVLDKHAVINAPPSAYIDKETVEQFMHQQGN